MKHILSHRIVRHLAQEERATKARYVALGKSYKIPQLIKAGKQEGQHSKLFQRLERKCEHCQEAGFRKHYER